MKAMIEHVHDDIVEHVPLGRVKTYMDASLKGTWPSHVWLDEASSFYSSPVPYSLGNLSDEERAWAIAFYQVLGVGHEFYVRADYKRRAYLREHYTKLAEHHSSKGRKAKRIYEKAITSIVAARLAPTHAVDIRIKTGDVFPNVVLDPTYQNMWRPR